MSKYNEMHETSVRWPQNARSENKSHPVTNDLKITKYSGICKAVCNKWSENIVPENSKINVTKISQVWTDKAEHSSTSRTHGSAHHHVCWPKELYVLAQANSSTQWAYHSEG